MAFNESQPKKNRKIKIPSSIRRQFEQPLAREILRLIWRQGNIALGTLVAALGFTVFQVPFKLAAGGVTGLGIILNQFISLPVGMIYLVLNIPLMVLGFFQLGRWRFLVSSVLAVICFSFATDLFNVYLPTVTKRWPITDDLLLASIYAGVLFGIGMGIIYRAGGTIGGTSIPARILYERMGFPLSQSYLFSDGAIILLAGLVFRWEVALLAILSLVLSGIVSDLVLEGVSQVRTATIVTKKPDDVRLAIIYQLRRGVSLWSIQGGYSKSERTMVFCTILRSRVADLKYTIATVDPDAFIIIGVAQQVVGGYGQRLPSSALKMSNGSKSEEASTVSG
ncbi:membrane protein [Desulfosarcina widdelii]|uniref:Membrane protein n=1 Tax=Desulfosarcina widdelii TaxID=947919 RepID=A0A5K7ZBM8_9BACT|nr:YitT family protein [Desulfosarcina widdelii]BBO78210.1 membrane protein [Desulfosarcina widdelii]